jgi:hypothetical protein
MPHLISARKMRARDKRGRTLLLPRAMTAWPHPKMKFEACRHRLPESAQPAALGVPAQCAAPTPRLSAGSAGSVSGANKKFRAGGGLPGGGVSGANKKFRAGGGLPGGGVSGANKKFRAGGGLRGGSVSGANKKFRAGGRLPGGESPAQTKKSTPDQRKCDG